MVFMVFSWCFLTQHIVGPQTSNVNRYRFEALQVGSKKWPRMATPRGDSAMSWPNRWGNWSRRPHQRQAEFSHGKWWYSEFFSYGMMDNYSKNLDLNIFEPLFLNDVFRKYWTTWLGKLETFWKIQSLWMQLSISDVHATNLYVRLACSDGLSIWVSI